MRDKSVKFQGWPDLLVVSQKILDQFYCGNSLIFFGLFILPTVHTETCGPVG
jgi:hypothetical protein